MDIYDIELKKLHSKKTDSLGRAMQWAEDVVHPMHGIATILTDRDIKIFEAIQRHDILPAKYIHAFVGGNYVQLQRRLSKLRRQKNTAYGDKFLHCPRELDAVLSPLNEPLSYELTDAARAALADRGKLYRYQKPDHSHYKHRLMNALVSASIELGALRHGFTYRSAEEIFSHPNCPPLGDYPMSIPMGDGAIVHDRLFAIDYGGSGTRFFVVETDRATEQLSRRKITAANSRDTSFSHKITLIEQAIAQNLYRKTWGLPSVTVITVTTSQGRMNNLIEYVKNHTVDPRRYLFRTKSTFGVEWKTPSIMWNVFSEPWYTTATPFNINRP